MSLSFQSLHPGFWRDMQHNAALSHCPICNAWLTPVETCPHIPPLDGARQHPADASHASPHRDATPAVHP